jgi:solute carrier family 45, member 1/2/4
MKYMATLTFAMLGLQIVWSVETAFVSPYMLSLGLSKNVLSIVLIAGPLSGMFVQPFIGAISDRLGRRKPFILGGAVATVGSLLLLPRAKEEVEWYIGRYGYATHHNSKFCSIVWAITLLIVLDCSINTMQAGIRAFIVDNAPTHQQERANAWATRWSGIGNILAYLWGANDWSHLRGSVFSENQFLNMSFIASVALFASLFPPLSSIKEEQLAAASTRPRKYMFKDMWKSIRHLPRQVKAVCYVQLAAWVGWFLILFYTTTYVGEIYVSSTIADHPNMTDKDIEKAYERGTKKGTEALIVFACTSLAASVLLPFIVTKSADLQRNTPDTVDANDAVEADETNDYQSAEETEDVESAFESQSPSLSERRLPNGQIISSSDSQSTTTSRSLVPRWIIRHGPLHYHDYATTYGLVFTLRNTWIVSHITFAFTTLLCTFFVRDTNGATILIGLIGIPWAMTLWAPFALIAAEISRLQDLAAPDDGGDNIGGTHNATDNSREAHVPQAGVVLGIHNVAIAAPQVVSAILSSLIFRMLEKPRGTVGDESVAWVFRMGGLFAVFAAFLALRVREGVD